MRWLFVVLAGCSFDHGVAPSDGSVGVDGDGPPIDMPPAPTCFSKWLDGTIHFDTPVALDVLTSTAYDRDPFLPADELTIYFCTARGGDPDVWKATRATTADAFGTPEEASEFNSTAADSKLSISADGKIAVISSNRSGSSGYDVWESIRNSTTQVFPAMNRTNMMTVDTSADEFDATVSADGQHLYYAPNSPYPQHVVMATRGGSGAFGSPIELDALNSPSGEGDPAPTPDERIILFSSNRTLTGAGNGDIYYATRASTTAAFGAPAPVPDINTVMSEGDPHVSSDGCRVYFARNVPTKDYEIYVASAQ